MQSGVIPNKRHPWVIERDESERFKDFPAMDQTPFFIVGAFIMFVFVVIFCIMCQAVLKWIRNGGDNNLMWSSFRQRRLEQETTPVCYPPPENLQQLRPENPLIPQNSPQSQPRQPYLLNQPTQPSPQMQHPYPPNQLTQPTLSQGDQMQHNRPQQPSVQQFRQPATAPQLSDLDLPPEYENLFPHK